MILFTQKEEWEKLRESHFDNTASVGYVPTMGALHKGHASLLERAAKENEICVCSIFVNPTQFNQASDLDHYPRTLTQDLMIAEAAGCSAVYFPQVNDLYGENVESQPVDYGSLTNNLEGVNRPGHFAGVTTIVGLLFDAIRPDRAYFGEKDFQQLAIIREMTSRQGRAIDIIGCDLIRDADGLALSSRNVRLSPQGRQNALALSQTLKEMQERVQHSDPSLLEKWAGRHLEQQPGVELEYLEIVDSKTLESAKNWELPTRALVAAWVDGVRLIDNVALS